MSRGFVFSLDAAFALTILLIMITALAAHNYGGNSNKQVFQSMQQEKTDEATIALYHGTSGSITAQEFSQESGVCTKSLSYDPNNSLMQQAAVQENYFCSEVTN